jgi:hypothetical protein
MDVALCRRGHVVAFAESGLFIDLAKFCDRCGAAVYSSCPSCCAPFPSGVLTFTQFEYPRAFCRRCGLPFPWATREDIVAHLQNVLAEDRDLAEGDRRVLAEQLDSLRRAPVDAAIQDRQLRALERLRAAGAKHWEDILPVLTPILTAELERALGLPPC